MDWNLFWVAFGAIGTTVGSLITAIAVFVAIKQYKQPLEKRIVVCMNSVVHARGEKVIPLYCFSIMNKGIRSVIIDGIYIASEKKIVYMNEAQYKNITFVQLPVQIEPERNMNVYFVEEQFNTIVKQAIDDKVLKINKKLKIIVQDTLGEEYICRTKVKIRELLK